MQRLKELWNFSGKYKYVCLLLPLVIITDVLLEILIPYIMGDMMNTGLEHQDINYILVRAAQMAVAAGLLVGVGVLESFFISRWSNTVTCNMRNELFRQAQELPFSDTDKYGTGAILTRMTTDMNYIKKGIGMYHSLLKGPIMIVCTIVTMLKVYNSLVGIFVFGAALLIITVVVLVKKAIGHYRNMFVRYDDVNNILEEDLVGVKTTKAFSRGKYEYSRFRNKASELRNEARTAERLTMMMDPLLHLVLDICILLIVYLGGKSMIVGDMKAGDVFCIISYANQILVQIYVVALIAVPILSAQISLDRVLDLIRRKPEFDDKNGSDVPPEDGSISFRDVSFGYCADESKLVLKNINIDIKSGEFIGITGPSGSGKTSLINLIPRFYDCGAGSVYVGGRNVKEFKFDTLRSSIGLVPQQSLLFTGTVKDNLLWGNEDADASEIVDACTVANANDFVMRFSDGYDTIIGQGGSTVSGGQKQRLCIARALIRNPRILILDDSLSAVDNVTENCIKSAIEEKYADTTVIMIAQRISSIRNADRIIVMNNGEIDSVGTHDELLENSDLYKEIFETQRRQMD